LFSASTRRCRLHLEETKTLFGSAKLRRVQSASAVRWFAYLCCCNRKCAAMCCSCRGRCARECKGSSLVFVRPFARLFFLQYLRWVAVSRGEDLANRCVRGRCSLV
jgi:hypothetical protein